MLYSSKWNYKFQFYLMANFETFFRQQVLENSTVVHITKYNWQLTVLTIHKIFHANSVCQNMKPLHYLTSILYCVRFYRYSVFKIHWLMAALAFTKSTSLVFHSVSVLSLYLSLTIVVMLSVVCDCCLFLLGAKLVKLVIAILLMFLNNAVWPCR